ncbi:MAG: hypothetical protein HY814_02600 [Candidatus Riflebacteria bacterium]|nr:hypothetical protein [Candidatus Riflebacteria bacterium]
MFADFDDLLWAKEMPHKALVLACLYHLPGALVLAFGAVLIRMGMDEILQRIHRGMAVWRLWSILCILLWVAAVWGTTWTDSIARTILWDRVVAPPAASKQAPRAPAGQVTPARATRGQ